MSESPTRRERLFVKVGERSFPLEPDRIYVVGSHENDDLRLNHVSVAPHHATLSYHRGQVIVEDPGSPTGTFVDGQRIDKAELAPGASIRVGEIDLGLALEHGYAFLVPQGKVSHAWRREESFSEIMAAELKRAPWFTLSALLHALVLWLLILLLQDDDTEGRDGIEIALGQTVDNEQLPPEAEVIEEAFEVEETEVPVEVQQAELEAARFDHDAPDDDFGDFAPNVFGSNESMFASLGNQKGQDILKSAGGKALSGGFKSTVGKLRDSGLEIVFAFDSTSSMDPVIQATKKRIGRMLEVLHALVPNARIGVVTYRDTGRSEEYLTRSVPLGYDFYRSMNFIYSVRARGGGDRPEAVFEALTEATKQQWQSGSRRVVVLIGDAPAHHETERRIENLLRNFSHNGRSYVHAIMTSPNSQGQIDGDTQSSFGKIARFGGGTCLPLEKEEHILREVISLAIGNEYRESIDSVYDLVDRSRPKLSTRILDMVRRADLPEIEQQLSDPVNVDDVVTALRRSKDKKIAEFLVELLARPEFSETGRQAAAYALHGMLALDAPPIDADRPGPIQRQLAAALRERIRQHPF